jgi:dolichol-phosphate mannosyltransferase
MQQNPELSIIVAVYNEDPRNLDKLLERLHGALDPISVDHHIIFVDDGSSPLTKEALKCLARDNHHVRLVVLSRNFGQQAAISAGIDHSTGDVVVNLDSDCQDPPEIIPVMLEQWRKGYDVVYAQRHTRRDRLTKTLPAFLFYRMLGAMSSVEMPWDTGDFRLMDRKVVNALKALPERTRFLRGLIPWMGFKQIGIAIDRDARELGKSTYTLKKLLTLAMDGLLSLSSVPLYAVFVSGGILMAVSLLLIVFWALGAIGVIPTQLHPSNSVVLLMLLLLGSLQLIGTGCVAVYLAKVLDEARGRPAYIVAERMGFSERDVLQARSVFSRENS